MRNPIQEYEIARSMPIQALANVLRGVSDMVSLGVAHAALKEKMEAEVAKKGASAMQMAQAPKVKDKDLAMAQGLASTPADLNVPMGGIVGGEGTFGTGAAGGGSVVAFQEGGQPSLQTVLNQMSLQERMDYQRSGRLPERFRQMLAGETQMPEAAPRGPGRGTTFTEAAQAQGLGATPLSTDTMRFYPGMGPLLQRQAAETQAAAAPAAVPTTATQAPSGIATLQADTGGVPTQTLAGIEEAQAAQKAQKERAATSDPFAMLNKAQAVVSSVMGPDVESAKDQKPEEFMTDIMGAMRKAGVDFGMMKDQMAELAKEKEEIKGGKKEAANLRLLEAGLGILGGESPYAFVNIGKGASPALKGFAEDIKDIQKQSRIIDKETRELARMQNELALGTAKFGMESYERKQDRVQREKSDLARNKTQLLSTVLGGEYQLKAARERASIPTGTERLIEKLPGKTFEEKLKRYEEITGGNKELSSLVNAYIKMSSFEQENFKKANPGVAAAIEAQMANTAGSGMMLKAPPSGGTIRE